MKQDKAPGLERKSVEFFSPIIPLLKGKVTALPKGQGSGLRVRRGFFYIGEEK